MPFSWAFGEDEERKDRGGVWSTGGVKAGDAGDLTAPFLP